MAVVDEVIQTYLKHFPPDPVSQEDLGRIEQILGVISPDDFKRIASVFRGDGFVVTPQFQTSSSADADCIVGATIASRRAIRLPKRYALLCQLDESFMLMETKATFGETTPVLWLDDSSASVISKGDFPSDVYRRFPDYLTCFAFLLKSELKMIQHELAPV